MKKFLLIFTICASFGFCVQSNAQSAKMYATASGGADSIRCTGTVANYLYVKPTQAYKCASYQANITRISAAMGGSIILQGSNDGVNFLSASAATGDTITVTDAATLSGVIKTAPATGVLFQYYRLKCVGASSDTMTVKGWFNGRP